MIADREQVDAAPAGMVRVNLSGFFAFSASLWQEARDAGRDYLTWDQWNAWGRMAIRCRIVLRSDLTDDPEPAYVPRVIGAPFRTAHRGEIAGARPDALFWRYAIIKTWRRAREARDLGRTDREFHNDEQVALKRENELRVQRERENAQARYGAPTTGSKHRGAAGEKL